MSDKKYSVTDKKIIDENVNKVFALVNDLKINSVDDIMPAVFPVMLKIRDLTLLTNDQKQATAIGVLLKLVDKANLIDDVKNTIKTAINTMAPSMIDGVYELKKLIFTKCSCCK